MLTRRSLFGILAGAVAAPIVVKAGLLQSTTLATPAAGVGIDEYLRRYIESVTVKMAEEIERDLFLYGTAWTRHDLAGMTRIDPLSINRLPPLARAFA